MMTAEDEEELSYFSEKILKDTRGHPIMVKFYLLGDGLHADVERRYTDFLRLQSYLVC